MTKSQELFFDLLLVCTGARNSLRQQYTEEQWNGALTIAQEQTVVGVLTTALERLPKEQLPSKIFLLQWLGQGEVIVDSSSQMAEAGQKVVSYFRENGFACQILKGSSVARYYPIPNRRSSGDIDVWLDGTREEIYDFARRMKERYNVPIVEISRYGYNPGFADHIMVDVGIEEFLYVERQE